MTASCYLDPKAIARARFEPVGRLRGLVDPELRESQIRAELDEQTLASLIRQPHQR